MKLTQIIIFFTIWLCSVSCSNEVELVIEKDEIKKTNLIKGFNHYYLFYSFTSRSNFDNQHLAGCEDIIGFEERNIGTKTYILPSSNDNSVNWGNGFNSYSTPLILKYFYSDAIPTFTLEYSVIISKTYRQKTKREQLNLNAGTTEQLTSFFNKQEISNDTIVIIGSGEFKPEEEEGFEMKITLEGSVYENETIVKHTTNWNEFNEEELKELLPSGYYKLTIPENFSDTLRFR